MLREWTRAAMAAAALLLSTGALAGGWISGGGELLEDHMNPWFFYRGDSVVPHVFKYCVAIDEADFGITREQAVAHVRSALGYWFDELTSASVPAHASYGHLYVGYEHPVLAPCADDDVVLRFQLGELTVGQLADFEEQHQDPRSYVALAVRTDYNSVTMQGAGFIYVSPPRGPLAMHSQTMIEDPWQRDDQQRLGWVLRHEIGHVFGVQHTGTHMDLMGVGAPEYAISSATLSFGPWLGSIFKTIIGSVLSSACAPGATLEFLKTYFSLPTETVCVALVVQDDHLEVGFATSDDLGHRTVGGVAPFAPAGQILSYEPVVRLWLPDGQTVFPDLPASYGRVIQGPMATSRQLTATYLPRNGGPARELSVRMQPGSIQVGGVWNGRIVLDVLRYEGP
jgi:hypothetical protein